MESIIAYQQKNNYKVSTPVYEGPLDLLLQLIEKSELDITKVAIAQVTNQYLQYLHHLDAYQPEEVSAFLVIASRLIQIKSEALLPRPVIREEGEEDPGEALARQILLYRAFRDAADYLGWREANRKTCYLRLVPPPKIEANLDLGGMGLSDLISAANEIISKINEESMIKNIVAPNHVTIRQKISLIMKLLKNKGNSPFSSFLSDFHSRVEITVTFLAILELIKRQIVQAKQERLFGEIDVELISSLDDIGQIELEFED